MVAVVDEIQNFINVKTSNNFQYLHRESAHSLLLFKWLIKGEFDRDVGNTNGEEVLENISKNNFAFVINHKLENTVYYYSFYSIETLTIDINNPLIDPLFRNPNR